MNKKKIAALVVLAGCLVGLKYTVFAAEGRRSEENTQAEAERNAQMVADASAKMLKWIYTNLIGARIILGQDTAELEKLLIEIAPELQKKIAKLKDRGLVRDELVKDYSQLDDALLAKELEASQRALLVLRQVVPTWKWAMQY